MLVLLTTLKLVLKVPAQLPNVIAINQNNVQQLQSFVLQNLQYTLQDMNNMATGLTGHPGVLRSFIIKSNHQPQNTYNPWNSNLYSTILHGSNLGSPQLNVPSLSNIPNMQLSIGTIISRPYNPGYDDRITFNQPPAFFKGDLYHGLPKTVKFINNPSNNQSPPQSTIPMNTFAPEYVTPTPVIKEENNGNKNILNDNDQDYDIDVRHQ